MKVGGGVTADVEQGDIASCAVTSGTIAAGAMTCGALAAGAVGATAALGDAIVTSEKASTNLRHNTVSLYFDGTTSTEAAGVAVVESTALVAWRPRVTVNVLAIEHVALSLHGNATCDNFTLYGNAGTCIGDVALKAVSTAVGRGTRTAGSAITQSALAAGTNVLVKLFTSTCSQPGKAAIIVHFESTG